MTKKVSVVLLNWNGSKLLEKFLPSVVRYTRDDAVDILVIDNNSTDDSREFLSREFPQVKQIHLTSNLGYAGGYNEGLKCIDSDYYVLLNTDVELSPNWLAPMINYLDSNKDIAAAQPKILSYRDKSSFEYAGAAGGYIDRYGYPFCRGRVFDTLEKDIGQYDDVAEVFWASGACLLIRADKFWKLGGFDTHFFAHMEEIDLCWRINASGSKIVCIPNSVVYHLGAATLNAESGRKTYLNFRNNLLMLYKNNNPRSFWQIYSVRFFLDGLASLKLLLSFKQKNALAVAKAHLSFFKSRKRYKSTNTTMNQLDSLSGFYNKSIVRAYYLKGKKYFSDLNI